MKTALLAVLAAGLAALQGATEPARPAGQQPRRAAETAVAVDEKAVVETAIFAGGCFWCMEPPFEKLPGVREVVSGYTGGAKLNPTYEEVSAGTTGHAEVVQVTFDPRIVAFKDLLDVFFTIHDPTTLNRQGADVGTQYRSAVFYHTPEQKAATEEVIAELGAAKVWNNPIVTEIAPLDVFYPAENYHQEYFARNPYQPYCQVVVAPKVSKFRKQYIERLKK